MSRRAKREAPQLDMWATEPAAPADESEDEGDTEPSPWVFTMEVESASIDLDPHRPVQARWSRAGKYGDGFMLLLRLRMDAAEYRWPQAWVPWSVAAPIGRS